MARNKKHKQKFASKTERSGKKQGGKQTDKKSNRSSTLTASRHHAGTRGGNAAGSKERQLQQAAARKLEKEARVKKEQAIGSMHGPPRILGMAAANESGDPAAVYRMMCKFCATEPGEEISVPKTVVTPTRHRFTLVCDDSGAESEQPLLDIAKIADIMILTLDCSQAVQDAIRHAQSAIDQQAQEEAMAIAMDGANSVGTYFNDIGLCITDLTRETIKFINAQGSPSVVVVLQGLQNYDNPKRAAQVTKLHERYFTSVLCSESRVLPDTDGDLFLRTITNMKLRTLMWREVRPYFIAEDGDYDKDTRTMKLSGYLRGSNLSANQLVHVTNHGTFKIKQIIAPGDPTKPNDSNARVGVLDEPDENQESLEMTQINWETLADDDGQPTEHDVTLAIDAHRERTIMAPEGVSEYQAAWYDYEDAATASAAADATAHDFQQKALAHHLGKDGAAAAAFDTQSRRTAQTDVELARSSDVLAHERMTDEERYAELAQLRELGAEEAMGEDEMETPHQLPARQRFQRYRGMKSFITGKWDTEENLPIDYAKIFKLQGYSGIREASMRESREAPVPLGEYITVVLEDVDPSVWDCAGNALIASGLLRHEQKMTVSHFQVQRNVDYEDPIKSKTTMLAQIGFRKFFAQPIYSDCSAGDRTKFARYFQPGDRFRIATFFAPITFHSCPIMLFKALSLEEHRNNEPLPLCAFGSTLPPNPDLLILKRVVLTGRIATIYKKQIVVKYMFFNDEDVRWFQPVDLYTRLGRRGKITKAVGTHGLFKAALSDQVFQHDVIMMDLWKRVYPKWKTVEATAQGLIADAAAGDGRDSDDLASGGDDDDLWEDDEDAAVAVEGQ